MSCSPCFACRFALLPASLTHRAIWLILAVFAFLVGSFVRLLCRARLPCKGSVLSGSFVDRFGLSFPAFSVLCCPVAGGCLLFCLVLLCNTEVLFMEPPWGIAHLCLFCLSVRLFYMKAAGFCLPFSFRLHWFLLREVVLSLRWFALLCANIGFCMCWLSACLPGCFSVSGWVLRGRLTYFEGLFSLLPVCFGVAVWFCLLV